jgi:hypothetical protein
MTMTTTTMTTVAAAAVAVIRATSRGRRGGRGGCPSPTATSSTGIETREEGGEEEVEDGMGRPMAAAPRSGSFPPPFDDAVVLVVLGPFYFIIFFV